MAGDPPKPRKYKSGAEKRRAAAARAQGQIPPPPSVSVGEGEPRYPSGAQKRQAQRAREVQERVENAEADKVGRLPTVADFERLPPPPIGKPIEAITWANDLLLLCLDQVARHPALSPQERWRFVKDLTAVLGLVRDKAHTQALLAELRKRQQPENKSDDVTPIAEGQFQQGWAPAADPGAESTPGPNPDEDTGGGQPEPAASAGAPGGGGGAPAG